MANNLIDLPKIEDMTSSVFGKVDPFAQQKPTTATSLLGDFVKDANKPIELSAGAQKMVTEGLNAAQNVIELSNKTNAAIQNQIEASQAQQAAALKQQQAIQQQRVKQEKLRQAAIKEQEAKQKKLEKELKEKIKADPLKVAQPRANVLLNSPEYKAASTEKKKDMVASFLANQKTALAAEIKDPDLQTAVFNETQGLLYSQLNKDVDAIVNDGSHFFSDLKTSVTGFAKGLLGGYEGSKAASISQDIDAIKSGTSAISNGNLLSEATRRQLTNYTIADKPLPQPLRNAIVNELSGKLTEQTTKADRYYQQQKDIKEGYSAEVKDSLANLGYTKAKKELELAKEGKQLTLAGQISEGIGAAKDNWYALSLDSITPMLASIGTGLIMRNAPAAATIAASSAAGGLFTSSDVVSSARDAILSADDAQLKRIKGWDAALAQAGGNKELARRNIATVAASDKAGVGFLMGAALSVFGPETLASLAVGKVLSRGAAQAAVGSAKTAVAKNVGLLGASVVSEGLEEGATQYLANVAAAEVDPMKDVGYNAGIGAVLGGVMSAAPTIASTAVDVLNARALNPNASPTPSGQPAVSGDVLSDLVNERVGLLQNLADAGKLDTSSINKVLYEGLERIPSEVPPQGGASTWYSGRQAFFDAVYESDILQNRLTPAQQAEIKSYIATAFSDINTNPYDYAAKTAELLAFYASDANSASSDMTKDAIAVKTNNGAAVADPVLATATAQALQAIDPNINESTKERMLRWTTMIRPDIYERNPDLTEEQKNQLDRYMHDYIDVTPRRMTDAQVAQQQAGLNQVPPSAQPVAGQPTQVQPLMGTNVPTAAAASSAQGSGNNLAQQTFTPTNLIQPAPQTSQSLGGSVTQPAGGNPVGQASQVAAAPATSSGPLIGAGTIGQTGGIQPVGQSGPSAAPTPVSSGSAAATQAKRNANAQRPSTSNQGTTNIDLSAFTKESRRFIEAYRAIFDKGISNWTVGDFFAAGIKIFSVNKDNESAKEIWDNNTFLLPMVTKLVTRGIADGKSSSDILLEINNLLMPDSALRTSGVMALMAYIEYEQAKAEAQSQRPSTTTAETGQVSDDVVISDGVIEATSLPYTRLAYDAKSGTTTRETGSSQIISIAGRPVILVTVNGIKIPFYRSTGLGGKTDVKSGKWYPVFGIGSDGWFNKTSGTTGINDYYGIPQLRQIAEHLDATISENDINTALTKSAVGTSSLSPQTYQLINQSFPVPPTVNGTTNTLGTVQQNIDFVKSTLAAAPSVGTQSVDGATMGIALPSGATAQVVTPIGRRVRAVTNDETLLSRIEPIFNDAAGRITNEQLGRMMTAFTESVRAGAADDQVVAAVQNALRPTTQTVNVPRGQAELGISLNDPSVIGKEVVRRGERGILVRRGKNIYFVPYMGENDINVGTINTDATLQALGFTSVSDRGTRTTNQIANRTNQAGREFDAIWQDVYSALQPSTTEQEVDSAIETAIQEPIVDVEAEFNEALGILTEYFNGDENAALDALETLALSDEQLLADLSSGDLNTQKEAVLEAASMLESTKLYNDYNDALELAYEQARALGEVDLLESAVSGLVENYPNVTDRIAILEDYVNNSGQPATSPSANVGPVTQATPEYTLTTSSPDITGAVEQLLLPPSQRTGKRKLTSKSPAVKERIRKAAMSDIHVGSPADRMFAYIDSSKLAVKREQNGVSTIGSLTRENGRIVFVPDDGALPSVEITGIDKMSTFNSYNKKSTVDTLTPTVPLHMTEGFINNRIPNYDSTAKTNAPTQKTRVSPIESVATQRAAETTATTADTTEAPAAQEVTRYSSGPIQLDGATAEVTRPTAPVPSAPSQPAAPDAFDITLSASTYSIPGLRRLQQRVDAGDAQAATLLHHVAKDMLTRLTGAIDGVELSSVDSYGLYKGDKEPSLGITVTVTNPEAIPELLAALAKFADNFNQQQVHVREDTNAEVGYDFGDGSFATPVYRVALNESLSDTELNRIMTESGLVGLTANEQYLEFYYVGEVGSEKANEQIDEFFNSAERAQQLLGAKSSGIRRKTQRLYIYGEFGGIPYNQIASGLRTQSAAPESVTARRIAEDQVGRTIEPAAQQDITPQQRALQTQIRDDYEAMPMDDLSNPLVQRAYTELADEVKDQFLSMPIKVDLLSGQGEPYASSTEMRRDILDNNHLSIFATEPDTFGSDPSIDYSNHPLLQPSGIKILDADGSIVEEGDARYNEPGKELLYNDLFRAVHDYYAHTVSPVAFGPKGEEAAWKNHMAMMRSPWAAWALTTETRGQNSWVNFSPGMENRPIQERPFAPQKTGLLPLQYSYTGNAQVDAKLDTLKTELSTNEQQGSLAKPEPEAVVEQTVDSQLRDEPKQWLWKYESADWMDGRSYIIDSYEDGGYFASWSSHPIGGEPTSGFKVFKTLQGAKNFILKNAHSSDKAELNSSLSNLTHKQSSLRVREERQFSQAELDNALIDSDRTFLFDNFRKTGVGEATVQINKLREFSVVFEDANGNTQTFATGTWRKTIDKVNELGLLGDAARGGNWRAPFNKGATLTLEQNEDSWGLLGRELALAAISYRDSKGSSLRDNTMETAASGSVVSADQVQQEDTTSPTQPAAAQDSVPVEARLTEATGKQVKAALTRRILTAEERQSLIQEGEKLLNPNYIAELLTTPQENLTDVQNSALDKIARYVDKGFADRQLNRQKANRNTAESTGQKTVADVITTQERDVVDAFLESRNEENVTAEDLVEQVISNRVNRDAPTDPLIVAAEADSRIKRIIDRIWNALKNTVAVVAVALAAYTGMASNNDAYAATTPITVTSPIAALTQDANAAHQYVQQNGDNANKPYIIADKKGGAVHLFDAQGNLLATTPALFGKNISDTTRAGATPAGKFTIKYASTPAKGYGGTVQALANSSGQLVQSSVGTVAIHRTYTANGAENRPARLASKSVTDNRISNGCINVPSSFYNAHLDSAFDGYVYVLPETKASPYRPRGSDITTTTQRATELRAPTRAAKTTTQTTVPASAVISAQAAAESVVTETISTAPITIEGTKPSGQVAMVKPVAVNEVSHSTMNVPQGTHTPLEQSTKPAFDTVAPDVTTESGWDIAGVVLGVLGSLGVGGIIVQNNRRARRLTSRRNATQPTLARLQTPAAQQTPAAAIAATVAPQASITPPAAPSPVPATPTTSAAQQFKVNELASAMHQAQWFDYMTRVGGLDEAVLQDLFFAETNLFRTMTDKSLQQALENDLQAKPWNVGDRLPGKLKGALGTIIYLTNGAKPALDNLLIKYGAPVVGVESDSPRFSMILSAIGGMANAAVREMTTANITPITKKLEKLSYKYRKGFQEIAEDFGRYATLDHLLSEGFNEHIRAKEGEIDTYVQIMALQDAIIADPNSSAREVSAAQADRDIAARNRTRLENQLLVIRSTIEGTTTPIDRAVADQYLILTAHQTAMQIEVARYNQTIAAQDAVLSNPNASAKDKNAASKAKNSAIAQWDALTKRIDDIQDTIDSLPFVLDPALLQQATANVNSAQRTDEVRQATTKLSQLVNARSKLVLDANNNVLWNGDTDVNGNVVEGQVKMPGGYTRRQAQQEFDRLKSMYDIADLDSTAADIVKAYNRATIFAGASGVYRASDYKRFKDIGFKKYVALYRKSLTPADLNPTNEENVESSELADLLRKYPTRQVRSLGLQDDVTRYSRDGSSEPAADAYTNLLLFTRQHGSLIAQAPLRREIELLYEGTWQNVNQTGVFSTKRLEELEQKGEIPGIVRYLPGKEPANLKDVRPISAWGHIADANGEQQYVRMNYYFTDTVIQEQIGRNITLGESADGNGLLGGIMAETRAYTRFASQLMTRFNPRFQLFTNVFNETWERATTAAFRDVVDVNGNPVSVTSLTASHAAHVAENMTIGKRREIYRYITTGEVKTKLQYVLHEMYGRGAIHLQTDLVEKQNMMEEYKKALSTRALDAAGNRLKRLANKSEVVGSAVDMSEDALDFMLMQLSEVTQVALVLASAQAYIDNGVNLAEASNRVRDSFDAMRAPNWQTKMGALFPFVRATMSGVYNNIRSLTQTEGQASKVAGVIIPKYITSMALLLATNLTLLGLAASLLGDDDDDDNGNGTPLLAKLPSTAFKQGVPLPNPFGDGIIYLPIGHGIGSAMWQMAASLYRTANGTNDTAGLMGDLTTIVVENTLPIQLANSKLFGDEMGDWAVLSMTPQMLKPIVELATNRNSFTGAEIVRATTPRGERDSAQGNFKMPQGYRDLAAGLYDATFGAVDMRPETIQHLSKGYFGYGPLRALDASFQDLSEATGGTRERRSEQAGSLAPIAALTGFGTFVDNQSLQADILSFGVQDKAYNKLAQYGVELTDPNNKPGEAINTIVNKLTKESATPADIVFIKNTLEFTKERKALEKQFADEAKSYNEQRAKGIPADATRMQTLQANIDILTRNYVKENSKYE